MSIFRRRAGRDGDARGTEPSDATRTPTPSSSSPPSGAPSPQVHELASFALAHAVRSVVPEGGPLIPFTILETAEGRSLHRFAGELGAAVEHARHQIRGSGAVRAAVAWDGYLTGDGRREDALFVEASEPGRPSVVVAHRYVETADGARAVGEPLTVGHGAPLL